MGLFLFRFWPVLVPLLVYYLWHMQIKRRARKTGQALPHFRDGPWYWAVLTSLLTAVACFIYVSSTVNGGKGTYIPPHVENGTLIPGHVDP